MVKLASITKSDEIVSTNATEGENAGQKATSSPQHAISTVAHTILRSGSLVESEKIARDRAKHSPGYLFLVNGLSVFLVFLIHFFLSPQTVFGAVLTVGATLVSYYATENASAQGNWDGTMSWVLLSLAVVMPMMATVKAAFERRERALRSIAMVRSKCYQLYLAHARWDWGVDPPGDKGRDNCRSKDWLSHSDRALTELLGLGADLHRFLTLPVFTDARHRVTEYGRIESARTADVSRRLYDVIFTRRMTTLALLAEDLKRSGLALPEMIRIRKWERTLCGAAEELRAIKAYRTPQALRSFARIFTAFLPPFYGPLFAQLARDADSPALGVCFGLIASLALTALFEANSILEDPFLAYLTVDGIDVHGELIVLQQQELMGARSECFPHATEFK